MRSFSVELVVVNRPLRFTRRDWPRTSGLDGLIVATSKARFAFAAIGVGGGGGSGIAHAVAGVARARLRGPEHRLASSCLKSYSRHSFVLRRHRRSLVP